jgi:glutathione S-transferase
MLKILGKSSSINVRKVLWLFDELLLSYEQEQYGSGFKPTDTDAFKAMNPNAMVPVLVDDGFVLWESNTICRYLACREQRFDLLPSSPRERAMVEKWMDWQATELNNSWRYAFMALVRHSVAHADQTAIDASIAGWNSHMGMVEAQLLCTGAYMAGDVFTLADIVIGLSVNRWFMTPMPRPDLPAVQAYYDRLNQRPGYQVHGRNGMP